MESNNHNAIGELRLSARVRRYLQSHDIGTIEQLCLLSPTDLLAAPGLGRTDVAQVTGELQRIGRHLRSAQPASAGVARDPALGNALNLTLHALFAASAGDTMMLEMTAAGQTVARYDILELLRAEAEECEPANRVEHLRHTATDLRRVADLLDRLALEQPNEA